MKIYVAAKYEEAGRAKAVMVHLQNRGFCITYDWTNPRVESGNTTAAALCDLHGAMNCDVLLLLNHPNGKGMFTEMGAALAKGRQVVVVEPDQAKNIFFKMPGVVAVPTLDEAYMLLDALNLYFPEVTQNED